MRRHFTLILLLLISLLLLASGCGVGESYNKYAEISRVMESGNAAVEAKRYDEAIKYYDRGLVLAPGQPTFLTNKSTALRLRGVERYNASLKLKDDKSKIFGMTQAKLDIEHAAITAGTAVDSLKRYRSVPFLGSLNKAEKLNVLMNRAESMRLVATVVDRKRAGEALDALHEYIKAEPDKEQRLAARLGGGKMLIEAFNGELAAVEYKAILSEYPDNLEAILGAGLALAQSNDSARFRESKQYLKSFIERAPANHPQMSLAKEILASPVSGQ